MARDRVRIGARVAAAPSIVGLVLLAINEVDLGMLWLLIPMALSGVILSIRIYPIDLGSGQDATARMNASWKRTFVDIGWLTLLSLVALLIWAVAVQFIDGDESAFGVAALAALMAGGAVLLGVLVSIFVFAPLIAFATAAVRGVRGLPVDWQSVSASLLLFSVIAFAVSLVFATSVESDSRPRGEAWQAILLALTGIESDDAFIVSQPLIWVARVALLLVIASVIWLAIRARNARRRAVSST